MIVPICMQEQNSGSTEFLGNEMFKIELAYYAFPCQLFLVACTQGRREKMWGPGQNFLFDLRRHIFKFLRGIKYLKAL